MTTHYHHVRRKLSENSRSIRLADGACWNLLAENHAAERFIQRMADVMQLRPANGDGRDILVRVQNGKIPGFTADSLQELFRDVLSDYPWEEECRSLKGTISCRFHQNGDENLETVQMMQFASLFALDTATRGGMPVHGALIEQDGMGVILAGPGGVGKTTACSRLPQDWRALSDDTTLIVRDAMGQYWAHPWPTWSRFLVEQVGGRWEVETGVRLRAICFLSQSDCLELLPLGEAEMVCMGMESIEQASRSLERDLDEENLRKLRNLTFRNICQFVKNVTGYRLNLDLNTPLSQILNDWQ